MSNTEQRPYVPAKTIPTEFPVRSFNASSYLRQANLLLSQLIDSDPYVEFEVFRLDDILIAADILRGSLDMRELPIMPPERRLRLLDRV